MLLIMLVVAAVIVEIESRQRANEVVSGLLEKLENHHDVC
jgi:hypothetical protein